MFRDMRNLFTIQIKFSTKIGVNGFLTLKHALKFVDWNCYVETQ